MTTGPEKSTSTFIRTGLAANREGVTGVLVSEKGTKLERETDVASTLMARDYKGFSTYPMTGVMEVSTEREETE